MKQTKRRKRAKSRKVRKRAASKPRKYFGTPSQLMINTIIRSAVKVLRRERRRLRWLIAQEYQRVKKLPKRESELLLQTINKETEKLRHVIMAEAGRI